MRILLILLLTTSGINFTNGQIKENTYELNAKDSLQTKEVKDVIGKNIVDKKVVFLGESEHHIGSDMLAKTEFVKYLVLEKGYKDIAFESDFFGLFFSHNKDNVFGMWSNSVQCQELFEFIEENDVSIWGFDPQFEGPYSYYYLSNDIESFLSKNKIEYDKKFIHLLDTVAKRRYKLNKSLKNRDIDFLLSNLDSLLDNKKIKKNQRWLQIFESLKSSILIYTTNKAVGIAIRDKQMAENLDYLVKSMPNKKFIVWLANAHMAKYEYDFMKGQTMGGQFAKLNPNSSYHVAFSSIYMPYRKKRWIEKICKDDDNLLFYLPSTRQNWFIDSKQLITDYPELSEKEYEGMFNLEKTKTNWFKHFDALVFISRGERIKHLKSSN